MHYASQSPPGRMWHLCSGPGHVSGGGRPDQTMADYTVAAKLARSLSDGIHAAVRPCWGAGEGGKGESGVHLGCLAGHGGRDTVISILAVAQHHHR